MALMRKIAALGIRVGVMGVAALGMAGVAEAHPGHLAFSFAAGLEHPLSGLDHIIAMISVGFCAQRMGGKAVWALPSMFMSVMAIGFAWAMFGQTVGFAEQVILISMFVLPAMALAAQKIAFGPALAVTAGFALFHGFAHGIELPASATSLSFAVGFVLATAALHALGLGVGLISERSAFWAGRWLGD